jgi:DNA-binding transcriptional MerR regulator/methylmalonyl-CoA mutase cobalamin-binding subunit
MYNIKEAAARTGVSVPVLRAWERRYGIVSPDRTPGGYRLYDDEALRRVRTMRRLVDEGWSPSNAAAAITTGRVEPDTLASPASAGGRAADSAGSADGRYRERFVGAAAVLDGRSVEAVLDEMFATATFERVAEDHLLPALRDLGAAWSEGRVPVAGEHLASNAVYRRLGAAFQAAGRVAAADRPVLIGLPPGARHELGAMIFAVAARRAGVPILYLGADLPIDDWLTAAEATNARAAIVGAPTAADADAALAVADALRRVRPGMLVALGGAGLAAIRAGATSTESTVRLPEELEPAVAALADALARPRGRRRA